MAAISHEMIPLAAFVGSVAVLGGGFLTLFARWYRDWNVRQLQKNWVVPMWRCIGVFFVIVGVTGAWLIATVPFTGGNSDHIGDVQQTSSDFDDLRWNKYSQATNAVDDFMRCARAAKPGDLGKPTQDREYQTGWPPYFFCGAVVQWDAQKAPAVKACLLNRSFGEEVWRDPSHRHPGGTMYSVAYDCGSMGLRLEVEASNDQAKVVRMQDFDYP